MRLPVTSVGVRLAYPCRVMARLITFQAVCHALHKIEVRHHAPNVVGTLDRQKSLHGLIGTCSALRS
jgi:hypothetical protein